MKIEEAAILFQSLWRRRKARENYTIKQLPSGGLTRCKTFVVGNDPKINLLQEDKCADKQVAMIATSGLRGLDLICQLGNLKSTPKLIIVDNSLDVITFWRKLRAMIQADKYNEESELLEKFEAFLKQNEQLYRDLPPDLFTQSNQSDLEYENQDPMLFFSGLIKNYGAKYVSDIIRKSTILGQSWTNQTLFASIKNILRLNGIEVTYAYPSNIPHCVSHKSAELVFESIEKLSPALSIFTNLCPTHHRPDKVILTHKSPVRALKAAVFPTTKPQAQAPEVYVSLDELIRLFSPYISAGSAFGASLFI